ncbi:phage integrase [Paraburkholderia fungorum]|uniref:Phage integrase n=1 Tax=Paraburkholderia fungorum TaxID=134537 RepID=A0AAP5QEX3_9BURK|nr:site-specific integrase [Paraburkholderia fungorum]AJZ58260.1 phage integrase [Paraburkholderia fungorum]MBU7436324.1 tyrosine-type recombinase/integrase [Paraburkholderia fungorum]MDT8841280.1 tyrosine-type recombinase/integrase [Paraburkholderia fungorum]PZR43591.1 MAG: site-specific integrase [Paraburkholderia fungorum]
MAHAINKLSATQVNRLAKPGFHSDGGGLYLQITKGGVKSWLFRYMKNGKARGMGLGPLHTISLAEARVHALAARKQLLEGVDPLDVKQQERVTKKAATERTKTFDECAEAYIEAHRSGWRNAKHGDQWTNTLAAYASPHLGTVQVSAIDTALVMKTLEPIWTTKTETASRVRGRIESVLDWATVRGYRSGENPARWKGHLDHLLPKRSKVQKVEHHAALAYAEAPSFMSALRSQDSTTAKALELLILTATRTNEILGARWEEFDLDTQIWTIPADRMKAGKEHRVPLPQQALLIVAAMKEVRQNDHVFAGQRKDMPLSNMALLQLLKRMKRTDLTAHGFRSTFRDWVGETTHYPREVAEAALAHMLKDKAEAAYARGDLFQKRAAMMQDWADFLRG